MDMSVFDKLMVDYGDINVPEDVIEDTHFNDEDKLGKGKEMIDTLGELLRTFRDQIPDFSKNRTENDDIIGDAYEYLMRNFATEGGKSKGHH